MPKIASKSQADKSDVCWLCGKKIDDTSASGNTIRTAGTYRYPFNGVNTCVPGMRLHAGCDVKIIRQKERRTKSPMESKHDAIYKKFLKGDAYPDIQCSFVTADGCEVNGRLTEKFFKE